MGEGAAPCVSVIIPAYNETHYLKQTLASIQAQTLTDWEIILVDDGSLPPLIERLNEQDLAAVRVFYQANAGPGAARNRGMAEARGEYLAFCDSDDLWHPRKLELQMAALLQYPDANLCICNEDLIDGTGRIFKRRIRKLRSGPLGDGIFAHQMISMSAPLIKRSLLINNGLRFTAERRFSEDWNFWMRGADLFNLCIVDQSLTQYRKLPSGRATNQIDKLYADGLWAIDDALNFHRSQGLCEPSLRQRRIAAEFLLHYHRFSTLIAEHKTSAAWPFLWRLWRRPWRCESFKATVKMLLALLPWRRS